MCELVWIPTILLRRGLNVYIAIKPARTDIYATRKSALRGMHTPAGVLS